MLPQVYRELHSIALNHLRRERPGHTLQATALVNEAYMKLIARPTRIGNLAPTSSPLLPRRCVGFS